METNGTVEKLEKANNPGWRSDVLASLVVFMVALPLCIAIAKACNLPAELGIISGVVGGIVVGTLAGCPLQVSGPAAGLIVLVLDFVIARQALYDANPDTAVPPVAALGVVVLLAGLIQCLMALLRLGQWFRAVSPAVILGMLGGIGVVIFAKQFYVMLDEKASDGVIDNLLSIPHAITSLVMGDKPSAEFHRMAACVGILTLFVLVFWKKWTPHSWHLIPAGLIAVVLGTIVAELGGLPVDRVQVQSQIWESITWISWANLQHLLMEQGIWLSAFAIAVIASAETLLCATAVDQMHRGARTNYNRELFAQGVGNTICGILSALPITGVIVRSSANVEAGATSRWSAVLHGIWILVFVVIFPSLLQRIPSACLAAILVYTGIKLLNLKELKNLWKQSKTELIIAVITILAVVGTDLLKGVILGVVLSVIKLLYTFSHLSIQKTDDAIHQRRHIHLEGAATFLRLPQVAEHLESVPKGWTVHVHLDQLTFIDHACLMLLTSWEKQHRGSGGHLYIDWDGLHARFNNPRQARKQDRSTKPSPLDGEVSKTAS